MISENLRGRLLLVFLGAVCVVVLIVALWRNEPQLPSSIASLELKRSLAGVEASALIDHLHGKGVTPQLNLIGMYVGTQVGAVVYLSVYASDSDAYNALREMRSRISAGNAIFSHYSEMEVGGHQVSSCLGQGQTHYFFCHGRQLYWFAVDSEVAREAVDDLVRSVTSN